MNPVDFSDVFEKIQKRNQILFNRNSTSLQELLRLFRSQNHRTLILWAFYFIHKIYAQVRFQSEIDSMISDAICLTEQWAEGKLKMPFAKKAILSIHSLAKRTDDPVRSSLYHAIAQGLSSVHVETHAIGLVFYELTAIVLDNGSRNFEKPVQDQIEHYQEVLEKIVKNDEIHERQWPPFCSMIQN